MIHDIGGSLYFSLGSIIEKKRKRKANVSGKEMRGIQCFIYVSIGRFEVPSIVYSYGRPMRAMPSLFHFFFRSNRHVSFIWIAVAL